MRLLYAYGSAQVGFSPFVQRLSRYFFRFTRANGQVSAVGITTLHGTSFAAPAVAGTVALIQESDKALLKRPEGCRAILFAAALTLKSTKTWWEAVNLKQDRDQGSGALNTLRSIGIAQHRQKRNNPGDWMGWDAATLKKSDFDFFGSIGYSKFVYRVFVPTVTSGHKVKVALTWNSKTTRVEDCTLGIFCDTSIATKLTADYDLMIYDSKQILSAYSTSRNNNYEIVEFQGTPGEIYTIKIRKFAGSDDNNYGMAWIST